MSTPTTEPAAPKLGFKPDTSIQDWMGGLPAIDPPTEPSPEPGPTDPTPHEPEPAPVAPESQPTAPQKPVVAKVEAAKPAAQSAKPQDEWPRNKQNWEKFVAERDKGYQEREGRITAAQKERDDLQKQIEELRRSGPSPELDKITKERDELSERLRISDITNHPRFVQHFQNKIDGQISLAKGIVGTDKADKIASLLQSPAGALRDQQIEELVADLSPVSQSRIGSVINQLAQIDAERAGEIARAKENHATMLAEQESAGKAALARAEQQFSDMISKVQKDNFIFQTKDGDEAWNTEVKNRIEAARTLMFGNPGQETMMQAALAAVALPALIKHGQSVLAENEKLKKQVAELSAAQPKVEQQKPSTSAGQKVQIKFGSSDPMKAVGEWHKLMTQPEPDA